MRVWRARPTCQIPRPKTAGVIGVKVGIARRSAFRVMLMMRRRHYLPAKPRINEHNGCADGGICFGFAGDERAVNCIMGDNKYTDI